MTDLPKFTELPAFERTGERHSWGLWGKDDQLGMVNLLTPERVTKAASLVRKGKVFNLEPSRSIPHPQRSKNEPYQHHINVRRTGRSDYVDGWELHGGMGHMDGLRHMRYREFGYYQGLQDEELDEKVMLGINLWADHGLVGRGVFLDIPRYFEKRGESVDPNDRLPIGPELMEAVAADEGVEFQPGDIMLLRTGWMRWYLSLSPEERETTHGTVHPGDDGLHCPGLDASRETAAWLWDRSVLAAVLGQHRPGGYAGGGKRVPAPAHHPTDGHGHRRTADLRGAFSRLRRGRRLRVHGDGQAG